MDELRGSVGGVAREEEVVTGLDAPCEAHEEHAEGLARVVGDFGEVFRCKETVRSVHPADAVPAPLWPLKVIAREGDGCLVGRAFFEPESGCLGEQHDSRISRQSRAHDTRDVLLVLVGDIR